jgi:hypothetical protein
MTKRAIILSFLLFLGAPTLLSQESDYEIKTNFEVESAAVKAAVDAANSVGQLDSLKSRIDALEASYESHRAFLDKALYPETFTEAIANLRALHARTYDRVRLITDQGGKIQELEDQLVLLTSRLDSLTVERDKLLAELQDTKKSLAALRETTKRLQANLEAKDRLIFALVDSIFLHYDKDLNQLGDVQRDAVSRKLLKANVLARIYDVAADNVKFLQMTQLQPKDYAGLISQQRQFATKWSGLREKLGAVYQTPAPPSRGAKAGKGAPAETRSPTSHIDSVIGDWNSRLSAQFWSGLAHEFSDNDVAVRAFNDASSFAASIRQYVDSMKSAGGDASTFVDEVWKKRIDKEWRTALSSDYVLGQAGYAALDKSVSDLAVAKFDAKMLLYLLIAIAVILFGWWVLKRAGSKPAPK